MSNRHRNVFYTGVTNDTRARASEHRLGIGGGFTSKYNCHFLMYYEEHESIFDAIKREKQIKRWKHGWKLQLIKKSNPDMNDLFERWKHNT